MSILEQILNDITTPGTDLTQKVREICDQIMIQEKPNMKYPDKAPKGSTVFLSLEAPGRYSWEIGFLTLEREDVEQYVAVYHTVEKKRIDDTTPRRRKVYPINENKAEKILTKFAQKLKMIRGE